MIILNEQQINDIASNLECGLKCYYNKRTGEIKSFPDTESWIGADEDIWEEDINEIDENRSDYIEFENFSSSELFDMILEFAERIDNEKLRHKLIKALRKPKPFIRIKWFLDNSGEYKQIWFDFKNIKQIESVKEQLKHFNQMENDEI